MSYEDLDKVAKILGKGLTDLLEENKKLKEKLNEARDAYIDLSNSAGLQEDEVVYVASHKLMDRFHKALVMDKSLEDTLNFVKMRR